MKKPAKKARYTPEPNKTAAFFDDVVWLIANGFNRKEVKESYGFSDESWQYMMSDADTRMIIKLLKGYGFSTY